MLKRISGASLLALAACATTTTAAVTGAPIAPLAASSQVTPESLAAFNSICSAEAKASGAAPDLKLSPGMGTGGFKVDSASKAAQDWFNFGLALSHAFYHEDAKVAMKKAAEADPDCSLCAWGLAWSKGPTLNYGINDQQRIEALGAAEKAKSLAKDDKARRLAEAMVARYAAPAVKGLNRALGAPRAGQGATEPAFGKTLAKIAEDYPDDTELSVLAAHALLIPVRGDNLSGLKPALAILETVLKNHPNDTGAIHYFIHATEFADRAEDAIGYADKLGKLAPAASHLVHMPAHTFFHAGRYHDAAVVNAKAIGADMSWLKTGGKPPGSALPMYYAHNLTFGLEGALMSGDAKLALKYADHADVAYPQSMAVAQRSGVTPRTYVALARHAPDRMLAVAPVAGNIRFGVYRAYGRGEAFLSKGDIAAARIERVALDKVHGAKSDPEAIVARSVLSGRIAMAAGDGRSAARFFEAGARSQDKLLQGFMDPPRWWYPVRRSVAAAWLQAGDYRKAEAEATKSLASWKNDPLALWVLGKAQLAQGHTGAGEATMAKARELWLGDFDSITVEAI
jgi:tetratricopeptide (TPR) repeat protein